MYELSSIQRKCLRDISKLRTIMQEHLDPSLDGLAKPILMDAARAESVVAKQLFIVKHFREDKSKALTPSQLCVMDVWAQVTVLLEEFIDYYDKWENGHGR